MTTAYATHPAFVQHRLDGYPHPERPERIEAVWKQMRESGLQSRLMPVEPVPVDRDLLLKVHTLEHINMLNWIAKQEKGVLIDADTYALPESYRIARLAAGSITEVIRAVMDRRADNGLAAVRPPGHHATPAQAMGFCLLNNIAIAARYAQQHQDVEKVLIVDFDVHHGNGTQDVFYDDSSVLFISAHQHPFYPGTGALRESGIGAGTGYTLNIPLNSGYGDSGYRALFERVVAPAAERFQPDLILVSAGFDAHWKDPLASMRLTLSGYAHLTRDLMRIADSVCEGRIVFVMEGGYDLTVIGHGMRNVAHALIGDDIISDPYGDAPGSEPDVEPVIEQMLRHRQLRS